MGKGREGWKGSERGRLELIEFLMSSLPLPPPLFDQEDEEEEEEQSLESEGARKRERERAAKRNLLGSCGWSHRLLRTLGSPAINLCSF